MKSNGNMGLITFSIGDSRYGIDIQIVLEVNALSNITPVPLTPPYICGILNLRGQIITLISLEKALGLEIDQDRNETSNIIIQNGPDLLGLQVYSGCDVLYADPGSFCTSPSSLKGMVRKICSGIAVSREQVIAVLDMDLLLTELLDHE